MNEIVQIADHPGLSVRVRRSARARRMTLRVGRTDGVVTLTLPRSASLRDGESFVAQQAGWIAKQVASVPDRRRVQVGGTLPLFGREVDVIAGPGRSARLVEAAISVPDDARAAARVKALLRSLAQTHLAVAVDRYAEALGREPSEMTLRDTRSRWGSCSSRGKLMFSWRLVMAPPEILEYVAAHEVAHLKHMDHSPRFWAQVEALMPDYAPRRAWLRRHGASLQAIDFDAA
ncbi:MAG: SprT family zinc-dependent metalloprotease [Pseudomonadota bacterium]